MNFHVTKTIFILFYLSINSGRSTVPEKSSIKESIPVPFCFSDPKISSLLNSESIDELFQIQIEHEESKLFHPELLVARTDRSNIRNFKEILLRADGLNGPLISRVSSKVAEQILDKLSCQRNSTNSFLIENFLKEIKIPPVLCPFEDQPNCEELKFYRTISGICNNLEKPFEGSAFTAFGRLLPAVYEDGLSRARSQSVLGGPLPGCRRISVNLDSKPFYDIAINHFWVVYGQMISHDLTESWSIFGSGRKIRFSCSCQTKDEDFCNIIPIPFDDPFLAPQKCIELSATAQTFSNPSCTLGVKQQLNGETHFVDLSLLYGSDDSTSMEIRTGIDGLMKTTKLTSIKNELPPLELEGKTCSDSSETQKCFSAGDGRIMENIVLTGLESQWLRIHNKFATNLAKIRADWRGNDEILFQETRKILIGLHQHFTYDFWLPILIGEENARLYFADQDFFSRYDPSISAVTFNEVVTGVLRLHTFVRDTMTRCGPNGKFIDQRPLVELLRKCKFAYDVENDGLDSFLCGALHDYSYAGDSNYAAEIHHRLFEHKDEKGRFNRKDILSINICRAREHGIPPYNTFRQFCGMKKAERFEDFVDVMTIESIEKLRSIYAHPDDVDLLIGANFEKWHRSGVVGPVSSCLIAEQFRHLKYGDRFFFSHQNQFSREQLASIRNYTVQCFFCHTTDIDEVAENPFRPPDKTKNPTDSCGKCPQFDFNPWRLN